VLNGTMLRMLRSPHDSPEGRDLRLAVVDAAGIHVLVFPCRRKGIEWIDPRSGRAVEVHPTHWEEWTESNSASPSSD